VLDKSTWLTPKWACPSKVRAAFTLRGAAGNGALNLALHVGDDPTRVAENRLQLRQALALPSEPVWLNQVHGADVLQLPAEIMPAGRGTVPPTGDAAVTRATGVVLAIMVADCLPILLASRSGEVIGAAHAGWRGLAAGVIEATVAQMHVPGAELCAWLGPCIRQAAFEVGDEVQAALAPHGSPAFARNARGRWQCDLAALAREHLARLGVMSVSDCGACTYSDAERFFSHRRDGARGVTGRMAALIWKSA
jgi:hypothetical protein